jgi:hypothetical protein
VKNRTLFTSAKSFVSWIKILPEDAREIFTRIQKKINTFFHRDKSDLIFRSEINSLLISKTSL